MEYKIITIDKDEVISTVVESLSEAEYESIMTDIHRLQTSMLSKDYYVIVRDNIVDLLCLLPKVDIKDKYKFATINRFTYNVLGAFYAWIEYYESNFKDMFAPIKKNYYDNHFDYRMMYNLRIYMTHCEMGVTQIQNKFDGKMYIYIEPAKLLEGSGRLQKIIIRELQQMKDNGEKINLYDLVTDFQETFKSMHKELLKAMEAEIQPVINQIAQYLRFDDNGKALSCHICEKETGKPIFGLSSFMSIFIDKMCNPY